MTQDEKDEVILKMQYRNALFCDKLTKALSYGKCTKDLIKKNIDFNYLLDVLRRYQVDNETNCLTEEQFCTIRNKLLTLLNK